MFEYLLVPPIETFSHRFVPVYEESTSQFGWFIETSEQCYVAPDLDNEVETQEFQSWWARPEAVLGKKIDMDQPIEELIEWYEKLLVGAIWYKLRKAVPSVSQVQLNARADSILSWIRSTDFYSAPASTKYHDSQYGGLLVHSLKVYNNAVDLYHLKKFEEVDIESLTLCSLAHDWCKIGYYTSYMKNVKDDKTGTWHQETAYMVDQRGVPLGHGVSSMFLASRFVSLDADEALALRWHMGRWNCCEIELSELQKANESCPLVYLIQFADQLACVKYQ